MKILIVTPLLPPEPGGPSYYSINLKKSLEEKGNTVDIIAFREVRKYPKVIRHLVLFFKVKKQAKDKDVIIILDTVSVAVPSVLAAKTLSKKTVVRVGGDYVWERYVERTGEKVLLKDFYTHTFPLSRKEKILVWLQKKVVLKYATHIVFNTEWQRQLWEKPYGTRREKTSIIENAFEKIQGRHFGGNTFLCAWRSTAFKNIDTLGKAYETAQANNPNVILDVYKNVSREDLFGYMEHARALIIPSLTELSPNLAFEALSIGLPVLITQETGARDILGDAVIWIDPLNPEDISNKMCMLMDENEYNSAKERAGAFSYSHTYSDIAEEYIALLK